MDIENGIHRRIGCFDLQRGEILIPELFHLHERIIHGLRVAICFDALLCSFEICFLPQLRDETFCLTRLERAKMVHERRDVISAQGFGVGEFRILQADRICPCAIFVVAEEFLAICFKR